MYIENRKALHTLTMALNFAAKPSDWVRSELKTLLTSYLEYKKNREDIWESMNSWDCGRQDAYGDKLDLMFQRLGALSLARKIQRGNGRDFKRLAMQVIGEYENT
jgi:hypothetical protein